MEEWQSFIKKRLGPKYHEKSEKFKKMRAKQTMLHTMIRKGYAHLKDEMRKASTSLDSITRRDVWICGHTRKSGGFLNEEVANAVFPCVSANAQGFGGLEANSTNQASSHNIQANSTNCKAKSVNLRSKSKFANHKAIKNVALEASSANHKAKSANLLSKSVNLEAIFTHHYGNSQSSREKVQTTTLDRKWRSCCTC
ncbi:unnamed protein product [Prunus armeniaca]|uniref:Uncharacterized protein n=1 Tax=Prunus armeniaca TaxID=36596 RepID=A0A6J5XA48_PRUAR|nr:unnamed protein product [Prunus armeniaca]